MHPFTADYTAQAIPVWRKCLGDLKGKAYVRLLEIGSYEGRSALWFLENTLTHPTCLIICVDIFRSRRAESRFDHNIQVSGRTSQVIKIIGRSQGVLPLLRENSYDIIYIDGSHCVADVGTDARLVWALLQPDSILIFDHYMWEPEKPLFGASDNRNRPVLERVPFSHRDITKATWWLFEKLLIRQAGLLLKDYKDEHSSSYQHSLGDDCITGQRHYPGL
ncbi:MAG TPA: class I SAM-dependent methyltransferase [Candidatus Limnocylindrales bacterium]|nr:class I SAM-dependent methyltransferase [Candidatus Limnocylindrales bacterium]